MKNIPIKYPNYSLYVEYYPYNESRKILTTLEHWWDHSSRKKPLHNRENYILDENLPHGLEKAFKYRMNEGCFNFVYHNDIVISYAGVRIENEHGYITRATTTPFNFLEHSGILSAVIVPFQIKHCLQKNCKTYSITFNEHRFKLYRMFRDKTFSKSKIIKFQEGIDLVYQFEFVGVQKIYGVDQYVCTIDLTRNDILEIINF